MMYFILGLLILILGLFISLKAPWKSNPIINPKGKFGELMVGNFISYIDDTKICIGYIQKIKKNGDIVTYSPSRLKNITIHKVNNNYYKK